MFRSIGAVVAGFALWTVLWLSSNAGLQAAVPDSFAEDGSTDSAGLLALFLVLSVVFSVISGWACAAIARSGTTKAALALGVLLLAVGIFVQAQVWDKMPLWYHLPFLILLVPGALFGARLRPAQRPATNIGAPT